MTEWDYDTWRREVQAADWHDIPRGYYADPVIADDLDMDDPNFCQVLGYKIFERRTARVCKNGRVIGADQWRTRLMVADGIDLQRLRDRIAADSIDPQWDRQHDIYYILRDVNEGSDWHRAVFGQLTGRCGCCGKALTDPDSKMRGIGPECAKGLRPTADSIRQGADQ